MLRYILPLTRATMHTAIQDSFVSLIEGLKWVVVVDWRNVTDAEAVSKIMSQYTSQERVLALCGVEGKQREKFRIVIAYVTEEFTNDELFGLLQKALQELIGVELWELTTLFD